MATASPSRDKVRNHRARMRAKGMKLVQYWVPDVTSAAFKEQALRESRAMASSPTEAEDQAFVDAISEFWSTDEY